MQRVKKMTDINEATPKSTVERMHRKFRPKKRVHAKFMKDRVVPKKTANNDPGRSGNRSHQQQVSDDIKKTVLFILDNINKIGDELSIAIKSFEHRDVLHGLLEHIIAVNSSGWKLDNGKYITENGRCASLDRWDLTSDGRLKVKGTNIIPQFELNWLNEAYEYCHE